MLPRALRIVPRAAALLAALLVPAACYDPQGLDEPVIGTHVGDWRDQVIYQIMVDRFADGDPTNDFGVMPNAPARYQGGDWQGILDHIDYLKALGITSVWISPVIKNVDDDANVDGYHGYWQQDFTQTNPHFGDLGKLRELTRTLHANGISVILDIVCNHIGQLFYYDINMNGEPDIQFSGSGQQSANYDYANGLNPGTHITRQSEYDPDYDPNGIQAATSLGAAGQAPIRWNYDPPTNHMPPMPEVFQNPEWYHRKGKVTNWADREQVLTADFPGGLKDLFTERPDVRQALIQVFSYWIDQADFDGFRIDTLKHVEHGFWQTFCPAIRQHCADIGKQNFFMFGESFDGDDALNGSYTFNQEVDSVFYFPQKFQVFDGVFKYGAPTQTIQDLYQARLQHYAQQPNLNGTGLSAVQSLVNFIDNHDIPRFLFDKPSLPALDSALAFLLTEDGVPDIYYGTEQNFDGGNDPANREDLWKSGYDTTGATFQWIAKLTGLRKAYAPLRRGSFSLRWTSPRPSDGQDEDAGIVAFERSYLGHSLLVAINANDNQPSHTAYQGSPMATDFPAGTVLVDVLSAASDTTTVAADQSLVVSVPSRGSQIWVPRADVLQ